MLMNQAMSLRPADILAFHAHYFTSGAMLIVSTGMKVSGAKSLCLNLTLIKRRMKLLRRFYISDVNTLWGGSQDYVVHGSLPSYAGI
jgi:hypothetical protein